MRVEKDTTARGRANNTTAFIIICIAIAADSVIVTKLQRSNTYFVSDIKKDTLTQISENKRTDARYYLSSSLESVW